MPLWIGKEVQKVLSSNNQLIRKQVDAAELVSQWGVAHFGEELWKPKQPHDLPGIVLYQLSP